jgi:L-rhamnose isomerase
MSERVDIELRVGQTVRTSSDRVEVVDDETGAVAASIERRSDTEVRIDGVRVPRPGEVEAR